MMDYGDVVVCAPVTVPYVRRSDKSAAWWLGSALRITGAGRNGHVESNGLKLNLATPKALGGTGKEIGRAHV